MNKTTVIYHSADFDGLFCREIARKFLPEAELIGWDFGNTPLSVPTEGQIYVLDLPLDDPFGGKPGAFNMGIIMAQQEGRLVWIDHHASAIKSHAPETTGYRIDGVAACRLAWQWFHESDKMTQRRAIGLPPLPLKEEFTHRKVTEPLAVRLAGEYDIWDKRDPRAELFQNGLRAQQLGQEIWNDLLATTPYRASLVDELLERGGAIQFAKTEENASIIKDIGFTFQWDGLTWLACNHARYNSHLFTAGLTPEHDACFGFKWTGREWSVSLYHAPGKEHHDLSLIAVKHGGGGHRGAAGMRLKTLPFLD